MIFPADYLLNTKNGETINKYRSIVISKIRNKVSVGKKSCEKRIILQTLLFFTVKSKDASKAGKGIPVDDPAASENAKLKMK